MIQYAYIEVNEKGTEAAAATVVTMMKRSIVHTYEVDLNRPFLYFISEKSTGLAIFSGCFKGERSNDEGSKPEATHSQIHEDL